VSLTFTININTLLMIDLQVYLSTFYKF